MRRSAIFGAFACAWPVFGQAQPQEAERIKAQVEAGALPRARLAEAESREAEARDEAVLQRTLFGGARVEELTPEDGAETTAAARRIFERRQARLERGRKLVEAGAAPRNSLAPLVEELDRGRNALELAEARAALLSELREIAERERDMLARAEQEPGLIERYEGGAPFGEKELEGLQRAYRQEFSRALPVSATGATAVHRALGYDHRGRVDVALDPDQPEGVWLRRFLESQRIPYFAFRSSVPGRATGPHIHIGPPSQRVAQGG